MLHVGDRGLNRYGEVVPHGDIDRSRKLGTDGGEQFLDAIRDLDGVAVCLPQHRHRHRTHAVEPVRPLVAEHAVDDMSDLAEAHRRAVAIGDDQRLVGGSVRQFGVRLQRRRLLRSAERSDGSVRAGGGERLLNFVEPDPSDCQQVGIDLNPDRVFLRAVGEDLRDPGQRRYPLPDIDLDVFVYDRKRHGRRFQRQEQNRRVARVHLAVRRRRRHFGRQLARGARDRRLDVLRRGVDVPVEVELHRDPADAEPAHRCDRVRRRRWPRTRVRAASRSRRPWWTDWRPASSWIP